MQDRAEREWLELVAELYARPIDSIFAERIALQLCATFELLACSYTDVDPAGHVACRLWLSDGQPGGRCTELMDVRREAADEHPLLAHHMRSGSLVPMQITDVPAASAGPTAQVFRSEIGRSIECPNLLMLPLRLGPGAHRAFTLGRLNTFRADEMRLAQILWRLLMGIDRQAQVVGRLPQAPGVATTPRLTPREIAVLGLLAEGLTAAVIGRRLAIAERTVHKHLEHVYAKMGVKDRLSAVVRAQNLGLLPAAHLV